MALQIFGVFSHFVLQEAVFQTKYCARLKSNILTHPKFCAGHATAHVSI